MKFFIALLSTIGFSTSSFALDLTNCKDQASGSPSAISFNFVFGLHSYANITYKEGTKTYNGSGYGDEMYTSDRNYNNEITFEGTVIDSQASSAKPSAASKLKIDLRIFTAKKDKGTAKVEMYKPTQKVLLCTQTE